MAIRQIRRHGDEILRKKAKTVKKIDDNIIKLLDDMLDTMRECEGLGLAATQVGALRKIAVLEIEDTVYELINPEIIETKGSQRRNEACLSVPGKSGDLNRPMYVKVKALNRDGGEYELEGSELLAAAISHEIDHLNGVLFIDHADFTPDTAKD